MIEEFQWLNMSQTSKRIFQLASQGSKVTKTSFMLLKRDE